MATYCFAERQKELFIEASLRGYLAAVLDFPHLKSDEESKAAAQSVPDALRSEVCCIPPDEYPYRHLVVHAWQWTYAAVAMGASERQFASSVMVLKDMPFDEALALTRLNYAEGSEAQEELEKSYARYLAILPL